MYHIEADMQKIHNNFHMQIYRASTAQLLGALASVRERTGRTGCETKATEITVSTLLGERTSPMASLI